MSKGKLILVDITTPVEGMKVVFGQTKDYKDNPNVVGVIENAQPEENYKASNVRVIKGDFIVPVPHSYLKKIAVEYESNPHAGLSKKGTGPGRDHKFTETLSLHPDDYEQAIGLIGQEVEFEIQKVYTVDNSRCTCKTDEEGKVCIHFTGPPINECLQIEVAHTPHAKLSSSSPIQEETWDDIEKEYFKEYPPYCGDGIDFLDWLKQYYETPRRKS